MASPIHRPTLTLITALLLAVVHVAVGVRATSGSGVTPEDDGKCENVARPVDGTVTDTILAGRTPVLFIHGILSTAELWTDSTHPVAGTTKTPLDYVVSDLGPESAAGYIFDWREAAGFQTGDVRWVTDGPGDSLVTAVECLAARSGHRVLIIAHSMGGLLSRYAAQRSPEAIAAVVTLGTPFRGSFLARWSQDDIVSGLATLARLSGEPARFAAELALAVRAYCLFPDAGPDWPGFELCKLIRAARSHGVRQMSTAKGSALPPWPSGVEVLRLAGAVSLAWERTWPVRSGESSGGQQFGDLVSTTGSQVDSQQSPQAQTLACDAITKGPGLLNVGLQGATCWHVPQPTDPAMLNSAITWLRARTPTTSLVDWPNLTYTSTCDGLYPDGFSVTLTDGQGTASVSNAEGSPQSQVVVRLLTTHVGDLAGSPWPATAVLLDCYPGGSYSRQEIHVFDGDRKVAQNVPLERLRTSSRLPPPVLDPSGFEIVHRQLHTQMRFYLPGDSHGDGPSDPQPVSWRVRGSELQVVSGAAVDSASGDCSSEAIQESIDSQFPTYEVQVHECDGEWAHIGHPRGAGDTEMLLRHTTGGWTPLTGFPTTLCPRDVESMGAPAWVVEKFAYREDDPACKPSAGNSNTPDSVDLSRYGITVDGIGPLKMGMTEKQIEAAVGTPMVWNPPSLCASATFRRGAEGLVLVFDHDGRLVDLVVDSATGGASPLAFTTLSGVRRGSTATEVYETYPGQVTKEASARVEPDMVFTPSSPKYAGRAIRFFMEAGVVTGFEAGYEQYRVDACWH